MARHTRSLPSRHGTLTQRIAWARGGPSDAIGLPPVYTLVMPHDRYLSLAEWRPWCTCTARAGRGPRWPQRGRTTSKVRRVWVVNGTACSWNPKIFKATAAARRPRPRAWRSRARPCGTGSRPLGSDRPARRAGPRFAWRAWSRHEERRGPVRCSLRVPDEHFHVHAYQIAVVLAQAARDEHILDIVGLAVGDKLVDRGHLGGEVERARVDDDDVRLLAWGQRTDLARHIERFGASHGGGAQHRGHSRKDVRVARLGALESDCGPHVVEHVGGVIGAAVEPEANADPGVLYVGVAHDARREPHVAERVVGHGGLEAGEGGDVGVARVDEVGRVQVAAERERASSLEHLE